MTGNGTLRAQAMEALEGRWGLAVGTYLIYTLITVGMQAMHYVGIAGLVVLSGPLSAGLAGFSLSLARKQEAKLEQIFDGFKDFETNILTFLWMSLYILPWVLLFIIPGIIKALAYSQVFYILNDDKTLKPKEALRKSEEMMDGFKTKFFLLALSFLGWALLCILTLGIGFLFLTPYMHVSLAKFYDDIRQQPVVITPEPTPPAPDQGTGA